MENESNKTKSSKIVPIIMILLGIILIGIIIFIITVHFQKMEENDPKNKTKKELIFESASAYLSATKNNDRKSMKKYLMSCINDKDSESCNEQIDLDINMVNSFQQESTKLLKIDKKDIEIYQNKSAEIINENLAIYLEKENKQWYIDYILILNK